MTSVKIRLNRSRADKDATYPLVIQVLHDRQKSEFYTPYRVCSSCFDAATEKVLPAGRGRKELSKVHTINNDLAQVKEELMEVCHSLREMGEYTSAEVVRAYKSRNDLNCFFTYADFQISSLREDGRYGTASNYFSAVNVFAHYVDKPCLTIEQFSQKLIERFVSFLEKQGKNLNSIAFYVKQIRAIYHKACEDGYAHPDHDPFKKVKLKSCQTPKRAIGKKELGRIATVDLSQEHAHLALARDLFLFSFYTRGMSFVDMCYLTREDIYDDRLVYCRRKTGQRLQIKIEAPLKALLAKYEDPESTYLLPMMRRDDSYNSYRYVQRQLNKRIRKLGEKLGFHFPLTFYVARHTWATLAHEEGVAISVVSEGMGHTSEKTTRIYLASLDHRKVDKVNKKVMNCWR